MEEPRKYICPEAYSITRFKTDNGKHDTFCWKGKHDTFCWKGKHDTFCWKGKHDTVVMRPGSVGSYDTQCYLEFQLERKRLITVRTKSLADLM